MPQTTNSITPNKLTVPDLISVGVFTALYFVLVTVVTFTCALLPGVGNIVLPALAALISGSVYMLLAAKLQKFGGITIMGLVMGLFFFVSGHFVLSFAANIVCGLLAGAPYVVALKLSKRSHDASVLPALAAVGVSIVVIALSVLVAWVLLRELLILFAGSLVVAFLAVVVAGVALLGRKPRS